MPTPTFYGGDGADLGNVSPLPASDWGDFVKAILGHPVLIPVSREKFHQMDKPTRDKVKRVRYVTPAVFKSAGPRRFELATGFNLVALDIDDAAQARPFWPSPEALRQALRPFGFAAYTTARSTPDAPRLRVFVRVDGVLPVASYKQAVNTVAALLSLPSVTKESYIVHQPMYLPSFFRDEDPVLDHPLFVSDTEGRGLTLADLVDDDTSKREQRPEARTGSIDDLEHLRPSVDGVTLEDCSSALASLDPDVSYPQWLEVAAALRHQFPKDPDASAAFELFDQWSARGKKYQGREETQGKWQSLRVNPKGRVPVTVRTLFHRATEAGWDGGGVGARAFAALVRWVNAESRTEQELMNQGAKKVAAAPLLTPMERGSLLNDLQTQLKLRGRKVSRSDLQAELKHIEQTLINAKGDAPTDEKDLPPWARGLCYVLQTNEFFHHVASRRMPPEVLDNTYSVHLMTPDSMETGKPPVLPRHFLLNLHRIPRVDAYRYDPSHPEEVFFQEGKRRFINTYVPSYPEADATSAEATGALFFQHLLNLCGTEEYARIVCDFLAYQVQVPGGKIRWAVLLQGAQGCGKTLIADAMRCVLGTHNVRTVDATTMLNSQYNEWATGAQLVAMEEVRVAGHNRHDVMNKLKPLITNSVISINQKFRDLAEVPNCSNYLLFTNHRDALAINEGDRRYFVIHSPIQTKDQVRELGGKDYFGRLYRMLKENSGGLRSWFENWTISPDFRPDDTAPETVHQQELIEAAASPLMAAIRELLASNAHPLVQPDVIDQKVLKALLDLEGIGERATDTGTAAVLRDLGYLLHPDRYTDSKGDRHKIWQIARRPHGDAVLEVVRLRDSAESASLL